MNIRCDYCGQLYEDGQPQCPHCGAPNPAPSRTANAVPKTVEQLKAYCDQNGYTPERTRFFVGQDYRGARAFGIYQDQLGNYIVYKNKADGSRAVRYQGKDEEYAVNQLYMRLQEEILNQKKQHMARRGRSGSTVSSGPSGRRRNNKGPGIMVFVIAFVVVSTIITMVGNHNKFDNGYYHFNNDYYYSLDDNWYLWDTLTDSWTQSYTPPDELTYNADYYYESPSYSSDYGDVDNFTNTDYYSDWEDSQSSSSYDDDDDWDSDWSSSDWDSGSTDWDSDW